MSQLVEADWKLCTKDALLRFDKDQLDLSKARMLLDRSCICEHSPHLETKRHKVLVASSTSILQVAMKSS